MAGFVRLARHDDMRALQSIWKTVFGDSDDEVELFFTRWFDPGMTVVAVDGGIPVAMGFVLPVGSLCYDNLSVPCTMIYAVATLPEHRGNGYGASVVRELISTGYAKGFGAIILCPSEDSLFEYYSARTELVDRFYVSDRTYTHVPTSERPVELVRVSENQYGFIREKLLSGVPHIVYNDAVLPYQSGLCGLSGGGLFRADTANGPACAIVERYSDRLVSIKELLAPAEYTDDIVSAVASMFTAKEYHVRMPLRSSDTEPGARRFGMLAVSRDLLFSGRDENTAPWFGLAYD